MENISLIKVDASNVEEAGISCLTNRKHPGFQKKMQWMYHNFEDGLVMYIAKKGTKTMGFIEYLPGEKAWRPVSASGYLFIQCIWVYPTKNQHQGVGSALLNQCIADAKAGGYNGVATMVSKGAWMATPSLFIKNGFEIIDHADRFDLAVYQLKEAPMPKFIDWKKQLAAYQGLHLRYANQCPMHIKSAEELKEVAEAYGLDMQVEVLTSPEEAQQSPSGYGTYHLIYNGKLLADHYTSKTRFKNIIEKDILVSA